MFLWVYEVFFVKFELYSLYFLKKFICFYFYINSQRLITFSDDDHHLKWKISIKELISFKKRRKKKMYATANWIYKKILKKSVWRKLFKLIRENLSTSQWKMKESSLRERANKHEKILFLMIKIFLKDKLILS